MQANWPGWSACSVAGKGAMSHFATRALDGPVCGVAFHRMEPGRRDWVGWPVRVTGEDQEHLFNLLFLDALIGDG